MRILLLAMRLLRREWRAGELRLLVASLLLAVGSMTAVAFFTDRIQQALVLQAAEMLGGDLVIAAARRLPDEVRDRAAAAGLRTAEVVEFPSMVIAGGKSHLATVAAVSETYPLRGSLRLAQAPFAAARTARGGPPPGRVWVEARLLNALGIAVGDRVRLGERTFEVEAVLVSEPARVSAALFGVAPRLMLPLAELPATGLVRPASRIRYRLLLAGEGEALAVFRDAAQALLAPGERIEGVEAGQPEVRQALQRARSFLGLAALVSVLLAGIATALATRRYMLRHLDACGLLRCLGCSRGEILGIHLAQLAMLVLAAAVLGGLLGYLAQGGLVAVLGALLNFALPPPSLLPLAAGLLVALVVVAGFSLPLLLHLPRVPALRVLRRELGTPPPLGWATGVAGLAAFAALVFWQAGDVRLGGYMLGGAVLVLVVLALAAAVFIVLLGRIQGRMPLALRFAVRNLRRRLGSNALQAGAIGIGITVLLLLLVVRHDLLEGWRAKLPPDAPNRFLINIQPDQVEAIRDFFLREGLEAPVLYPVVRGRLTGIGTREIGPDSYTEERARRLVAREFNLSWMAALPGHNRLSAGRWWTEEELDAPLFSVEAGLARTLGIRLGDELRYRVGGREVRGRVINLREVEWDSFRVNFFVISPPGLLGDYPTAYITSFHLGPHQGEVLSRLVQRFPNVTVLDVAEIMAQVRVVMDRVSLAVEYVFLFTLAAGLLVLYAAIQSTLDERIRESAVLRTLGAGRGLLTRSLLLEFAVLGLLAGVVAALAAGTLGGILARVVFEMPYRPDWAPLAGAALLAASAVAAAGYGGTRAVLRRPPLQTLLERA